MFELALPVIRPVTKRTWSSSNFEIEHKQVLHGDEKRSRRLTLDILTDVVVPTRGPSENVGKKTEYGGAHKRDSVTYFGFIVVFFHNII
jgi:hypothetical protein